ncbi:MAG: TetR/AcrR family transcriptional regulator, partial [Bacteroidota bacterium]
SQILSEAENLFMRYGLKSVSMDDVARKLGMSKKTLYQHFESKETLIKEVMVCNSEKDMEHFVGNMQNSSDDIDEYLGNSRYFISEMRQISPTLFYDMQKYYGGIWQQQKQSQMGHFDELIKQNILRGQEEGLYIDDMHADVIMKMHNQTIMAIVDTSLFPAMENSMEELIRQHALYHLRGILTEAGRKRLQEHLKREEL